MLTRLLTICALVAITGCSTTRSNNDVIIWISIDGMRHDYVDRDRERLPTFARLMADGAFTRQLVPVFPSITFPSHISQATGVPVSEHGVTANTFYDSRTQQTYKYPEESSLIEAEPIWIAAARQGVRSAVIQWPMSYRQTAPARADYFDHQFDKDASDADRLARLLQAWANDDPSKHHGKPLRLIMGYVLAPDKVGHKHGPDSPELRDAVVDTDRLLGEFLAAAQRLFERDHGVNTGDRLWIVLSTDHGMSPAKGQLKLDDVLGRGAEKEFRATLTGPLANLSVADRSRTDEIVARLQRDRRVRAWTRDQLPSRWDYAHASRTGDIVALLDIGWGWRSSEPTTAATQPATTQSKDPLGQHGYPVEEDPDMLGFAVISTIGAQRGARDLGRVDSLQLNPTVAKLLGIQPANTATAKPVGIFAP